MNVYSLTVRRVRDTIRVIAESREPGLTVATRFEESLNLDQGQLNPFPLDNTERKEYGTLLGKAVFDGSVLTGFQRAQARADQAGTPLHVLMSVEVQDLVSLRWEWMCAPLDGRWDFLRLQQRLPYSLQLPSSVDVRFPAISRLDLRALVVVANLGPDNAYGLAPFDARKTAESIRTAMGDIDCHVLACDGADKVAGADGLPTLDAICERITSESFPLLHVVCHGKFLGDDPDNENAGETVLFLRKSDDEIKADRPNDFVDGVTASRLIERLSRLQGARGLPHFTFLSACESAAPKAEQAMGGIGQRLVRELGMPAVIAMTEPVSISSAEKLAATFYKQLRIKGAVDQALDKACAGLAERGDVLVPALFSRLGGQKLFDEIGPLTPGQNRNGLKELAEIIPKRAPVFSDEFRERSQRIEPLLEADPQTLSETVRAELVNDWLQVEQLCREVIDLDFQALANGVEPPAYDGRCPFPGLAPFDKTDEEDFTEFFFGRDDLIKEIQRRIEDDNFLAVLGPSGSGKSSLVRAGLLKSLANNNPDFEPLIFLPGSDPLARLREGLKATPNPSIIVVDQFEELFTLSVGQRLEKTESEDSRNDEEAAFKLRQQFLSELLLLREKFPLVLTMRADFLGDCTPFDDLYELLDEKKFTKLIRPLDADDLRDVIELQANAVGLQFEPGLSSQILSDVAGEPGAMPLLQHCLRQLWQYRHGRWLTLTEYINEDRVGGVKGAIARTADSIYLYDVDPETGERTSRSREEKELIRYIFERLTRIDTEAAEPEKRRDTRRRETLAQLTPDGWDPELTRKIVNRLADAKLVVTSMRKAEEAAHPDNDNT